MPTGITSDNPGEYNRKTKRKKYTRYLTCFDLYSHITLYLFIYLQARRLRTIPAPDYVPPVRRTPLDDVELTPGDDPITPEDIEPEILRIPVVSCTPFSLGVHAVLFRSFFANLSFTLQPESPPKKKSKPQAEDDRLLPRSKEVEDWLMSSSSDTITTTTLSLIHI